MFLKTFSQSQNAVMSMSTFELVAFGGSVKVLPSTITKHVPYGPKAPGGTVRCGNANVKLAKPAKALKVSLGFSSTYIFEKLLS